jgi:hypothetical protein
MAGDEGPAPPPDPGQQNPGGPEPGQLLSDLARLRREARVARHGYWFPLVLFGLLTCGAAPFYVAAAAPPPWSLTYQAGAGPILLSGTPSGGNSFLIGWYWTVALVGGYLFTGAALTVLALAIPPLTRFVPRLSWTWLPFGDLWIRGTLAFLIIAAGLWVLAWAERSRALAVIALVYTGTALLASLYDTENILFRLGWDPGRSAFAWQLTALPNVLLPAAILLAAGLGAFVTQRGRRLA